MSMLVLGLQVASTALGAVSAIAQGNAQAQALEQNAALAKNQAELATRAGTYNANLVRAKGQSVISSQRAGYGASGVDSGAGSALDVAMQTARNSEMDALMEKYKGDVEASQQNYMSKVYQGQAKSAKTAGIVNAMGTLLTGASGVATSGANLGIWEIPEWNPFKGVKP